MSERVLILYWAEKSNKGWHAVVFRGQKYPGWLNSRAMDKDKAIALAREEAIEEARRHSGDYQIEVRQATDAEATAKMKVWGVLG
jgi:hypothetical protein